MIKYSNLEGQKFGRLTVMRKCDNSNQTVYLCLCECGNKKLVSKYLLPTKMVKSCGCLNKEKAHKRFLQHGMTGTRFHNIWRGFLARCTNPNVQCYKNYGGRGIKVSKKWLKFENFRDDMLNLYNEHVKIYGEKDTTIDRIDNNKNYCKENCKWSTHSEQMKNRRFFKRS